MTWIFWHPHLSCSSDGVIIPQLASQTRSRSCCCPAIALLPSSQQISRPLSRSTKLITIVRLHAHQLSPLPSSRTSTCAQTQNQSPTAVGGCLSGGAGTFPALSSYPHRVPSHGHAAVAARAAHLVPALSRGHIARVGSRKPRQPASLRVRARLPDLGFTLPAWVQQQSAWAASVANADV